jgi:hypothetical protein
MITSIAFTTRSLSALQQAYPAVRAPVQFIWPLAFILIVTLHLFPDGRFVPRSPRLLAVVAVVLVVLSPGLPEGLLSLPRAQEEMADWHWRAAVLGVLALWCTGLFAQVYRYRHVSGPVERQQAKWVMFLVGCFIAIIALGVVIPSLVLDLPDVWFAAVLLACVPLAIALPISIAIAMLRYYLYDIDRIISRTLAYGLLTPLLGGGYAGVVPGLGRLLPQGSSLTVAAATLAVGAAFQPARRRIQQAVDRRFNRRRHDAGRIIEAFGTRLRGQVDLDTLTGELLAVIDQTMQPTSASLWLRPAPDGRPRVGGLAGSRY